MEVPSTFSIEVTPSEDWHAGSDIVLAGKPYIIRQVKQTRQITISNEGVKLELKSTELTLEPAILSMAIQLILGGTSSSRPSSRVTSSSSNSQGEPHD